MDKTEEESLEKGTKRILADITRQRDGLASERAEYEEKIGAIRREDDHLRRIQMQLRDLLGGSVEVEIKEQGDLASPRRKYVRNAHRGRQVIEAMRTSEQEWLSVRDLTGLLGEKEQTVRNALQKLGDAGKLEKKRVDDGTSPVPRTYFRLMDPS